MRSILQVGRAFSRPVVLVGLSSLGLLVITTGSSVAGDPFAAGGASARPVALDTAGSARAAARAADLGRALGLATGRQAVRRIDDRFDHLVYDEVTTTDERGRPVAIQRLGLDGRLVMAVGLGWKPAAASIAAARAGTIARDIARAAGLDVSGVPDVRSSRGGGGWSASWPRLVDGVPVAGDGTRVTMWADGSFHAIQRSERPLAPRPVRLIPAGDAANVAVSLFRRMAADPGALTASAPTLSWVAPNDTFQPDRPDAPNAQLRLAWVVEARAAGVLAERLVAVQVWIDAGTGSVIGGDVAE